MTKNSLKHTKHHDKKRVKNERLLSVEAIIPNVMHKDRSTLI